MDGVSKFLRERDVLERTRLARSTMRCYVQRGTFPAPIKIGARASAWIESEIEGWMRARIQQSRGATA